MTKCKCPLIKRAFYNLPGEITGKWCSKCPDKPKEAINVTHSRCICGKHRPTFNLEGKTKPIWCSECKPTNAINVKHDKCECGKIPSYALVGANKAKWCSNCKPEYAINIKHGKCECGKYIATFKKEGETKVIWCSECKLNDAVYIHTKCKCGKYIPSFGIEGDRKAVWCSECKPENAVNVKHKKCNECKLTIVSNPNYEGYCTRCYIHLFPDKPASRNFKVKEKHIFDTVLKLLPVNLILSRDKIVGGCSKRRPDLMIDMESHWICIENDENSHRNYDISCENKRIMELYTDMANRPMILIRFNCDKYSGGKSLFKLNNYQIFVIRSKKEFNERINKLVELITKYIKSEPPERAITTEYLYYN
jgi:hypothetical protein